MSAIMENTGCDYTDLGESPNEATLEGVPVNLGGESSVVIEGQGDAGINLSGDPSASHSVQMITNSSIVQDGQHYIILTNNEQGSGEGVTADNGMPLQKKIKLEGDNETYFLTLSAAELPKEKPKSSKTVRCDGRVGAQDDVSQAWFTTKDDKMAISNQGVTWRKGSWNKDEVDLLQSNINDYCQTNGIIDPIDIIFKTSKEMRKDFYRTVAKGLHRPLFSVYRRVIRMYDQKNHVGKYSALEMERLRELRKKHGSDWALIGAEIGRSASSVKDKCRLMNDRCNSGKWLPEEEKRLTSAVYEQTGLKAGENITHGLSWSLVAEKVGSRSEKQCRTKWLNFLNWKVQGGAEWTRDDDINLVLKISQLDANDESEIDWQELAKNWSSVRSPQWLRGKWWAIKRHVPDYQQLPFKDVVECIRSMHFAVRLKSSASENMPVARVEMPFLNLTPDMSIRLPSATSNTPGNLLSTTGKTTVTNGFTAYEVLQQLTPTSNGSFLITQSKDGLSLAQGGLSSDHIIVHTLPVTAENNNSTETVAIQLNTGQAGLETTHDTVTSLTSADLSSTLQLAGGLVQEGNIQRPTLGDSELELSDSGEIIHVALHEPEGQSELEVIGHPEVVTSDLVLVSSASPQYVQSSGTEGQLLSSLTDPMLTSQSVDLICSTSDAEGEKSNCSVTIEN